MTRRGPIFLLLVFLVALPASAAKFSAKHNGNDVDVTNDDAGGKFKAFHYTPNNASFTVGAQTFTAVFEKDGSVTFNGVNAKSNEELLSVMARSGIVVTADELDSFIGMMSRGEINIVPKKRGDSLLQLLQMWRSRI